jgi:plasmid maintenance system antidote protein VapI
MTVATTTVPTAADLRAAVARRQITLYKLASLVDCHPGRLGRILNERVPLSAALAERIARALESQDLSA